MFSISCSANKEEPVAEDIVIENDEEIEETAESGKLEQELTPEVLGEMYTTAKVNVRMEASMNGEVYCTLNPRESVWKDDQSFRSASPC